MYQYRATVRSVTDGDTLHLDIDLGFNVIIKNATIRLAGINAPEIKTPEGRVSKTYLTERLPVGTPVILESLKDETEKYGRILGIIFLTDDKAKTPTGKVVANSINWELLSKGLAVDYNP
jgi:endonuclease YncB( thermonuclease family)